MALFLNTLFFMTLHIVFIEGVSQLITGETFYPITPREWGWEQKLLMSFEAILRI